jgi:hypothetical protein
MKQINVNTLSRIIVFTSLGLLMLSVLPAEVAAMGDNGGTRLLVHVDDAKLPQGMIALNPCDMLPPVSTIDDIVVEYTGDADTLWLWTYLAHPRWFDVKGVGFGIEYEGLRVITSGSCAPFVHQDGLQMGKWANTRSEIAFAWRPDDFPTGKLAPINWFLVERIDRDGFFKITEGTTSMTGEVGDTNRIPRTDKIWAYGKVGIGEEWGELPMPGEDEIPGAAGAVEISIQ